MAGAAALACVAAVSLRPGPATTTAELVAASATPSSEPVLDLSRDDLFLAQNMDERLSSTTFSLGRGDNLGPLLQEHGVSPGTAHAMTLAFADTFSPRRLRVGHAFTLTRDRGQVRALAFKPSVERTVFVEATEGGFASREVAAEFRFDMVSLRTTIENSIYVDAKRLGAPDRIIGQFAHIYEYSVDFQRDIQRGDEMEMFFEVARDRDGRVVKSGDLLYTRFTPRGEDQSYWLFSDEDGLENYYGADGKTAKRKLRATPVEGARLSSGYGRRRHPVLGYAKMHKGVDFAAPRGTPILAAGTGVVERANRYGSFGNYVRIRHTDGYKTAYAHLKGFASGIKAGTRVRQDQVIGYVGTTGRSTGPHLHYEVHHHGRAINPRKLSQLSGKPLADSRMGEFARRRAEIDRMRDTSDVIAPVAVLAGEAKPSVVSVASALD